MRASRVAKLAALTGLLLSSLTSLVQAQPIDVKPQFSPTQAWPEWRAEPAMISNLGVYRDHTFVYQDYIYDDHGPNTDGIDRTDLPFGADPAPTSSDPTNPRLSPTGGSTRYTGDFMYAATDEHMDDVADLIQMDVTADATDVYYRFTVADLAAPDATVIGICVNEDGRPGTGLRTWPFEAGLTDRLGCDHFITTWGTGAAVTVPGGNAKLLDELGGDVKATPKDDTIELRVPKTVADPGNGRWRYYIGAGLWDKDAESWFQVPPVPQNVGAPVATGGRVGSPQIWDLLSNNKEPNSYWREEKQANDLVQENVIDDFVDVDFGRIASNADDPDPKLTGFMNRIYISGHDMEPKKGILIDGVNFIYLNRYQPYTLVLPSNYYDDPDKDFPFDLAMHPLNGNHMVEVYYAEAFNRSDYTPLTTGTTPSSGYLGFSQMEGLVDRLGGIYACVLGRGEGVGYTGGDGLVDVLEVQRDVIEHYRVDADRQFAHGVSLGAIGSWYLSELYPDRFASVQPYIFSPAIVNDADDPMLRNLYNLPVLYAIGTADEFAQGTQGDPIADQMTADGNEFVYVHYLGRQHEGRIEQDVLPFVEALGYTATRVTNPPRVRYVFDPSRFSNKEPGDGSAYWVTAMKTRDEEAAGEIDAVSLARADQLPKKQVVFDQLWVNPNEGYKARIRGLMRVSAEEFGKVFTPAKWEEGWELVQGDPVEEALGRPGVSNSFTLTATNLRSATLNGERMGLGRGLTGKVDTDSALRLTITGLNLHSVTIDGQSVASDAAHGAITFEIPEGKHTVVVS